MDPNDQALMDGLQALGPLLLGARKHLDGNDDHQPKRHKASQDGALADPASAAAMTDMLRLMAQLILSHERAIQLQLRQDCFVLFAQDRPEGIIPHLKAMAPVSAGGSGVAVRLAAKVRCALVPPKPKEERPPLAESGAVELGPTKGNAKGKLGLN